MKGTEEMGREGRCCSSTKAEMTMAGRRQCEEEEEQQDTILQMYSAFLNQRSFLQGSGISGMCQGTQRSHSQLCSRFAIRYS